LKSFLAQCVAFEINN